MPDASEPVAKLLADYRSVGLFQDLSGAAFQEIVLKQFDADELEETWEDLKDNPTAFRYARHSVLGRIRGVVQNVGFAAADVLHQAKANAPGLAWDQEERGPNRAAGERKIALSIGERRLSWRYASVSGLIDGLNRLLRDAGQAGKFIGLATDGDFYCYVWGDEALEARMASNPLFQLGHEKDPLAGPA